MEAVAEPIDVERVLQLVREHGGRVTSARRGILEALLSEDGHATAEELTARVHRSLPDVDRSTVYRFLDELERLGVVDHVHLGHGPAVYHFSDDGHHHLVCESCGGVTEVPNRVIEPLRKSVRTSFGFELDPRHFAMSGRCAACRQQDEG